MYRQKMILKNHLLEKGFLKLQNIFLAEVSFKNLSLKTTTLQNFNFEYKITSKLLLF